MQDTALFLAGLGLEPSGLAANGAHRDTGRSHNSAQDSIHRMKGVVRTSNGTLEASSRSRMRFAQENYSREVKYE